MLQKNLLMRRSLPKNRAELNAEEFLYSLFSESLQFSLLCMVLYSASGTILALAVDCLILASVVCLGLRSFQSLNNDMIRPEDVPRPHPRSIANAS